MQESAIAVSTIGKWLVILTFVACMWELARNLWSNWGTSNFWTSSFAAALVGMLTWWVIGAIAYLSTPKKTEGNTPTVRQSAGASSIQQSASASGNTTITQVGGDLNVTQGGLSVDDHEMIKSLVKKKSFEGMSEFMKTYPRGFLIFGLTPDGNPVTYQGEINGILIDVDWTNLRVEMSGPGSDHGSVRVATPYIRMRFLGGGIFEMYQNIEIIEGVTENEPIQSAYNRRVFYEVLDREKRIFLIGFK